MEPADKAAAPTDTDAKPTPAAKKETPKADKAAAPTDTDAPPDDLPAGTGTAPVANTQKRYDEYKVDLEKNEEGKVTGYTKIKKLRGNIPMDAFRIEALNAQAVNTKIYYYEAE